MPNSSPISLTVFSLASYSLRTSAAWASVSLARRPPLRPRARAAWRPSMVRWRMRSRSSWLAKTTATGALSWQHVFLPSSDFSNFTSVRLTSDGGYVATGTADVAFSDSIWLVRTDTNGNVPSASSSNQLPGTTTEQAGPLTATTTNFPTATPANGPAPIADPPGTANLVIQSIA